MKLLNVYFLGKLPDKNNKNSDSNNKILLGKLVYKKGLAYFEYDANFLHYSINISPLNLKLETSLQVASRTPFNGLQGVFSDSLPDGWGLLLMDRQFRQRQIPLTDITPLDRLAYIGDRAMGALSYQPDTGELGDNLNHLPISIADIANESLQIYQGNITQVTQQLYIVGGSPGGARPKATIGLNGNNAISGVGNLPENYQHWIVKFPTGKTAVEQAEGAVEYVYSIMAKNAGINFPETQLIETPQSSGYFACKRFDRGVDDQRFHMHSFAGLVNADYRLPDSDYDLLMRATSHVTKSHLDLCEVLRRMIFNILSGNRDDHTKNFSYLMDADGNWSLSPAYDVTFNFGINGHHSMSIAGHGKNIPKQAIQQIANMIPLSETKVNLMIEEIAASLAQWRKLAKIYAIPSSIINEIEDYINKQIKVLS